MTLNMVAVTTSTMMSIENETRGAMTRLAFEGIWPC
jgi:hypothetical protein